MDEATRQLKNYADAGRGVQVPHAARQDYASADRPSQLIFNPPTLQASASIVVDDRRYVLRDLFIVEFSFADGEVFAHHRTLPVAGHGRKQMDAMQSFYDSFDFQYRHLVEVDQDSLTPGGLRRREAMQSVVERVEPIN